MTQIPVVLSTDENYWVPTCVTIASLVANAHEDTVYDIYVLYSGDVLAQMENVIDSIYAKVSMPKVVKFVSAKDWKVADSKYILGHVTGATFYRLYIADYLTEYAKCLYIDVDVLVCKDLTELYKIELEDYYLAGVKDPGMPEFMEKGLNGRDPMECMGLEDVSSYINAGVLVLNLEQLRKDNMVNRFVRTIDKHYLLEDQGILNHCCYGRIKHLPVRYNLFNRFYDFRECLPLQVYTDWELEGAEDPVIVHLTSSMKPWNYLRIAGSVEWWGYLGFFMTADEQQEYREQVIKQTHYEKWKVLLSSCIESEDVVLFGYGKYGKRLVEELLNNKVTNVRAIADNCANEKNEEYKGIPIISVEQAFVDYPSALWVISSQKYAKDMQKQLLEIGVAQECIRFYLTRSKEYMWVVQRKLYAEEVEQLIQQVLGKSCEQYVTVAEKMNALTIAEKDTLERLYEMSQWLIIE